MARSGDPVRIDNIRGFNVDLALDDGGVELFKNEVAWPFINAVTGRNFLRHSNLGDRVSLTFPDYSKKTMKDSLRIRFDVANTIKDESLDAGQAVVRAIIEILSHMPKMSQLLYNQYYMEKTQNDYDGTSNIILRKFVKAWQVQKFIFKEVYTISSNSGVSWNAQKTSHYELQRTTLPHHTVYAFPPSANGTESAAVPALEMPPEVFDLEKNFTEKSLSCEDLIFLQRSIAKIGFKGIGLPRNWAA